MATRHTSCVAWAGPVPPSRPVAWAFRLPVLKAPTPTVSECERPSLNRRWCGTHYRCLAAAALQPQRPSGAPSAGAPDAFVDALRRADTVRDVLKVAGDPRAKSVADVCPELLAALARLGSASAGGGGTTREDLENLRALLPTHISNLAAAAPRLSFSQLSRSVQSLAVLQQTQLRSNSQDLMKIVAPLPAAARKASTPPSVELLADASLAAQRLCAGLPEVRQPDGAGAMQHLMQPLASYLRTAIVDGPAAEDWLLGRGGGKRGSMAELAAALRLVAEFGLPQPPAFATAVARRVDQLIEEAMPVALRGRQQGHATAEAEEQDAPRGDSRPDNGSSGLPAAAASQQGHRPAETAVSSAAQRPGGRRAALRQLELDTQSLALLMTVWCRHAPQLAPSAGGAHPAPAEEPRAAEDPAPFTREDWLAWTSRTADTVLLGLQPGTSLRREQLIAELAGLQEQQQEQEREAQRLQRAAAEQQRKEGQQGAGGQQGSRRGQQRLKAQGGNQEHAASSAESGPTASESYNSNDGAASLASVPMRASETASAIERTAEELRSLGPCFAESTMGVTETAELLVSLAGCLGVAYTSTQARCLAEALIRSGLATGLSDKPRHFIRSLAALARMDHCPSSELISTALQCLSTALQQRNEGAATPQPAAVTVAPAAHSEAISHGDVLELLQSLRAFKYSPGQDAAPRTLLQSLVSSVMGSAGGTAPNTLLLALVQTCAAWGERLSAEALRVLMRTLERRVYRDVNPQLLTTVSTRFQVEAASGMVLPAEAGGGLLPLLLEGILLPLAELGQPFEQPDLFVLALRKWRMDGFPGLTARKAGLLLRSAADRPDWVYGPTMREDMEELMVRSLSEEALLELHSGAAPLADLLRQAARAVRIIWDRKIEVSPEVQKKGLIAETAAPRAAPLFQPAAEWLLELNPSAGDLAAAMQALFVELQWGNLATGGAPAEDTGPRQHQARAQQSLLTRMLAQAEPSLERCTPQEHAWALAACATSGCLPPAPWLARQHSAALEALQLNPASATVLVSLAGSCGRLQDLELQARKQQQESSDGSCDTATALVHSAKEKLLQEVALCLLQEPALSSLQSQPEKLVLAVRQVTGLGVQLPESTVRAYVGLTSSFLPQISLQGLANAAEGLALLGASVPASWLDVLLTEAERRAKAGGAKADLQSLGLLIGSAHALCGGGAGGTAANLAISAAARQAWIRLHATFVTESLNVLPRYSPRQRLMVVAAVAAVELDRQAVPAAASAASSVSGGTAKPSGTKQVAARPGVRGGSATSTSGAPKAGSKTQALGSGNSRAADFMGRVDGKWLADCGAALLEGRRASYSGRPGSTPALPSAALIIDLLALASQALCGASRRSIVVLPTDNESHAAAPSAGPASTSDASALAAQQVAPLREFMRLSLSDLSRDASLGAGDWRLLLEAVRSAGIQPAPPELHAYCTAVVASAAKERSSPESQAAVWAAVEQELMSVLLPALPWAPEPSAAGMGAALRDGFLLRAPLAAASVRQLGLVCTYCTQAGLGSEGVWRKVRAGLEERAAREQPSAATVASAVSKAQRGSKQQGKAGGKAPQGAAGVRNAAAQVQPQSLVSDGAASFQDVAAVAYALDFSGCGVPESALQWLERLAVSEGHGATPHSRLPTPGLATVAGLQQLWVSAQRPGLLRTAPVELWAASYGDESALAVLRLQQLDQLVLLRRAAAESRPPIAITPPPAAMASLLKHIVQRYKLGAPTADSSASVQLDPTVAAAAVVHCLPGGDQRLSMQPYMVALAQAAERWIEALPLDLLVPLLLTMGDLSGDWRLTETKVMQLAARLVREQAAPVMEEGPMPAGDASMHLGIPLLQVATALVRLGPRTVEGLSAALPLIAAAVPRAEEQLWAQWLHEHVSRSVREAGAAGGLNAGFTVDPPRMPAAPRVVKFEPGEVSAAASLAVVSIHEASAVMAAAVEALLLQELHAAEACSSHKTVECMQRMAVLPLLEATGLASAILDAGGSQPLPLPLAAVLRRLMAADGVVQGLSVTSLQRALEHSLTGPHGLPLSDATADALVRRLEPTRNMTPLELVVQLRRCGASRQAVQAALLRLFAMVEDLSTWDEAQVLTLLRELEEAEVQEPPRALHSDTSNLPDQSDVFMEDIHGSLKAYMRLGHEYPRIRALFGPFTILLMGCTSHLWISGRSLGMSISGLAEGASRVARLVCRLGDAPRKDVLRHMFGVMGVYALLPVADPECDVEQLVANNLATVWQHLEAGLALGGCAFNQLCYITEHFTAGADAFGFWQRALAARWERLYSAYGDGTFTPLGINGSLLMKDEAAVVLADALVPLLQARMGAVNPLGGEQSVGEQPSPASALLPATTAPAQSPLTARQLGLLYSLVAARGSEARKLHDKHLTGLADMVRPLYLAALEDVLRLWGQVAPLEYFTTVLDAVEPVVIPEVPLQAVRGEVLGAMLPSGYYEALHPDDFLARALQPLLECDTTPLPEGMTTEADVDLACFPVPLSEQRLMQLLYLRPPSSVSTQDAPYQLLPTQLLPPPGGRHGFGDPCGDRAREAYMRQNAPWYIALRRLAVILAVERDEFLTEPYARVLAVTKKEGRWATAVAAVMDSCIARLHKQQQSD